MRIELNTCRSYTDRECGLMGVQHCMEYWKNSLFYLSPDFRIFHHSSPSFRKLINICVSLCRCLDLESNEYELVSNGHFSICHKCTFPGFVLSFASFSFYSDTIYFQNSNAAYLSLFECMAEG